MEPQKFDDIEDVIAFARALPEFPSKAKIVERLETRNVNRYQEAMGTLAELLVTDPDPLQACGTGITRGQLEQLRERIARLEASDPVGG